MGKLFTCSYSDGSSDCLNVPTTGTPVRDRIRLALMIKYSRHVGNVPNMGHCQHYCKIQYLSSSLSSRGH